MHQRYTEKHTDIAQFLKATMQNRPYPCSRIDRADLVNNQAIGLDCQALGQTRINDVDLNDQ